MSWCGEERKETMEREGKRMLDLDNQVNKVIAALLTIAWASTKNRDVSQQEVERVYKNLKAWID